MREINALDARAALRSGSRSSTHTGYSSSTGGLERDLRRRVIKAETEVSHKATLLGSMEVKHGREIDGYRRKLDRLGKEVSVLRSRLRSSQGQGVKGGSVHSAGGGGWNSEPGTPVSAITNPSPLSRNSRISRNSRHSSNTTTKMKTKNAGKNNIHIHNNNKTPTTTPTQTPTSARNRNKNKKTSTSTSPSTRGRSPHAHAGQRPPAGASRVGRSSSPRFDPTAYVNGQKEKIMSSSKRREQQRDSERSPKFGLGGGYASSSDSEYSGRSGRGNGRGVRAESPPAIMRRAAAVANGNGNGNGRRQTAKNPKVRRQNEQERSSRRRKPQPPDLGHSGLTTKSRGPSTLRWRPGAGARTKMRTRMRTGWGGSEEGWRHLKLARLIGGSTRCRGF